MSESIADCECPAAGYCRRYRRKMQQRAHEICSGAAISPERRAVYVENWLALAGGNAKRRPRKPRRHYASGPGTELKKLIDWFMPAAGKCSPCQDRARRMDKGGPNWCHQNMKPIIDWLEQGAKEAGVPFSRVAAWPLVELAIARSRATEITPSTVTADTDPEIIADLIMSNPLAIWPVGFEDWPNAQEGIAIARHEQKMMQEAATG